VSPIRGEGERLRALTEGESERQPAAPESDAARKRVALETYVRNETALRRTARRYSICADDADDALQRGLEILLRKAPSEDPRELIRWTQTVVKHEALAVRRERERILSGPAAATPEPGREDWVAMLPAEGDGPPERAERHEAIARSREALQALKPQELRALTLLAEGYSYQEIGEITGYSQTKINRCLAEGRERFRKLISGSEDGSRCSELRPLLSAFCDGEAAAGEMATVREHLRACAHCRATLRAYRAAPAAAAALLPALPLHRSLLERAHDAVAEISARFSGGGAGDSTLTQLATAGGTRGAGMAALAKAMAVCVATVGGATACVATGVIPSALGTALEREDPVRVERRGAPLLAPQPEAPGGVQYETASPAEPPREHSHRKREPKATPAQVQPDAEPLPAAEPEPVTAADPIEYAPPPAPPPPVAEPSSGSTGSPAGEFGP
jgi:RNA polymerase sigma factor (sigma-70 family)